MKILDILGKNKALMNAMLGHFKKDLKERNITIMVLYLDNDGNIAMKEYTEPMVVVKQSDYMNLINKKQDGQP